MCLFSVLFGKIPCPVSHLGSALLRPAVWRHSRTTRPSALSDGPGPIIWACSVARQLVRYAYSYTECLNTWHQNIACRLPLDLKLAAVISVVSWNIRHSSWNDPALNSNQMCHLTLWIHLQGENHSLFTSSLQINWIITDLAGNDTGAFPELQSPSLGVLSAVAHISDNPFI